MISLKQCQRRLQECEYGQLCYKCESLIDILLRFLLVALNIEVILGQTSLARRKKMLQKVATTVWTSTARIPKHYSVLESRRETDRG